MENGIINQSYKIIDPVTEVLNLPPDDEIEICSEISGTPTLNTTKTPKHHSDDIETLR